MFDDGRCMDISYPALEGKFEALWPASQIGFPAHATCPWQMEPCNANNSAGARRVGYGAALLVPRAEVLAGSERGVNTNSEYDDHGSRKVVIHGAKGLQARRPRNFHGGRAQLSATCRRVFLYANDRAEQWKSKNAEAKQPAKRLLKPRGGGKQNQHNVKARAHKVDLVPLKGRTVQLRKATKLQKAGFLKWSSSQWRRPPRRQQQRQQQRQPYRAHAANNVGVPADTHAAQPDSQPNAKVEAKSDQDSRPPSPVSVEPLEARRPQKPQLYARDRQNHQWQEARHPQKPQLHARDHQSHQWPEAREDCDTAHQEAEGDEPCEPSEEEPSWEQDRQSSAAQEDGGLNPQDELDSDDGDVRCCVSFHNVPHGFSKQKLCKVFEHAGDVHDLHLSRARQGGSTLKGICMFTSEAAVARAVRMLYGWPLRDAANTRRRLRVSALGGGSGDSPSPCDPTPHPLSAKSRRNVAEQQHQQDDEDDQAEGHWSGNAAEPKEDAVDAEERRSEESEINMRSVFFCNVAEDCEKAMLWQFFSQVGEVKRMRRFLTKEKRFNGRGVCQYRSASQAEAALRYLSDTAENYGLGPNVRLSRQSDNVKVETGRRPISALPRSTAKQESTVEQGVQTATKHSVSGTAISSSAGTLAPGKHTKMEICDADTDERQHLPARHASPSPRSRRATRQSVQVDSRGRKLRSHMPAHQEHSQASAVEKEEERHEGQKQEERHRLKSRRERCTSSHRQSGRVEDHHVRSPGAQRRTRGRIHYHSESKQPKDQHNSPCHHHERHRRSRSRGRGYGARR